MECFRYFNEGLIVKPMLSGEAVLGFIKYPACCSAKLNGVRGLGGEFLMARSLKRIPNQHCQKLFTMEGCYGLDGELVVGAFDDEDVFVNSTSGVMSVDGTPDVNWYVFDAWALPYTFEERIEAVAEHLEVLAHPNIIRVPHKVVHSDEEMVAFADECLLLGYEGLVLRDPKALYKHGRSTALEGGFMRFCPWFRSEATIINIIEGEENTNPAQKNELGRTFRSHHKAGMKPTGAAGAATVKDLKTGQVFKITIAGDVLCKWFWDNRDNVAGKVIRYKFKPPVKKDGKPRFSQLDGFRDEIDMGE